MVVVLKAATKISKILGVENHLVSKYWNCAPKASKLNDKYIERNIFGKRTLSTTFPPCWNAISTLFNCM